MIGTLISTLTENKLHITTKVRKEMLNLAFKYDGLTFKNYQQLCRAYRITTGDIDALLDLGYSLTQAVTIVMNGAKWYWRFDARGVSATGFYSRYNCYIDHEGRVHDTITDMLNYWGADKSSFSYRTSLGESIESALRSGYMSSMEYEKLLYAKELARRTQADRITDSSTSKTATKKTKGTKKKITKKAIKDIKSKAKNTVEAKTNRENIPFTEEEKAFIIRIRRDRNAKPVKEIVDIEKYLIRCDINEYNKRRRLGFTHKESKNTVFIDPFGKVFTDVNILSDYYGMTYKTLYHHISRNDMTLAEIIVKYAYNNVPDITDYVFYDVEGEELELVEEFKLTYAERIKGEVKYRCKTYPDYNTFINEFHATQFKEQIAKCLYQGFDTEESIRRAILFSTHNALEDSEMNKFLGYSKEQGCFIDPDGNKFLYKNDMLEFRGLSYNVVYKRYKRGLSVEECLSKDRLSCNSITYNDVEYPSLTELCKVLEISDTNIRRRTDKGMSLEEAISDCLTSKVIVDHKGNRYNSRKELAEAYGVSLDALNSRQRYGWSLQEVLETPINKSNEVKVRTDHKGNKYKSKAEMLRKYGLTTNVFDGRIRNGWTLEKALETPVKYRSK